MSAAIEDWLGPGGAVARALEGSGAPFEPRPQQLEMAAAVERALASRGRLLAEAGTGVGKSFAYLVPAILRIVEHGEKVVVATNTIALQEQLLEKDVPLLRAVFDSLGKPFRPVLVKGRGNYVSIRRLRLASARQDRLFADAASRRSLHAIEDWAYATADGTLSTLPQLERPAVWERAQSDSGNCMGRKCPTYEQCFYQRARREMEQANLFICNHALFFSDLALREAGVGFIPPYDHVILDEAHNVEDVASEHFGASLSESRVRRLVGSLVHERTGRGFLPQLQVEEGAREAVDHACQAALRAEEDARVLFERALVAVGMGGGFGAGEGRTALLPAPGAIENTLTPTLADLALRLKRLKERATREDDRFELNAYAERAQQIADEAAAILDQSIPGCVYWLETSRGEAGLRVTLACAPVEVGEVLRPALFEKPWSVVLTSATLATGPAAKPGRRAGPAPGDECDFDARTGEPMHLQPGLGADPFAHLRARLGCSEAVPLLVGSPFRYAEQVELFVDRTMPDPRAQAYLERLSAAIILHARATEGGAFVLFTSFDTLRKAAERIRPTLEREGMPVLAQDREGPRGALLKAFRENRRSVLLGAASFWQGVDVRGEGLRNVIITRLPFEPPDRPLTQARLKRIEDRGGDAFFEDSLPRAVLRFKQGFGRLIRSAEDRGRVVVLDPRIMTKPYGKRFLAALPAGVVPRASPGPVVADDADPPF